MNNTEKNIIHSLWIGNQLSNIELLTINSFINQGHIFYLWVYDQIKTTIPPTVILKDANEIIPKEKIFNYRYKNQFGHGKGSYAGFSDIFRYKLLYEYGGWWTDMDVTCLKPLNFIEPYVFRTHHDFGVVGNLMKCPPKSELMRICYEEAILSVNSDNKDWNKPIAILNNNIEKLELQKYIHNISNPDSWNVIRKLIVSKQKIPDFWFIIHWVNEEWRRNKIDKNYYKMNSTLGELMYLNNIPNIKISRILIMKQTLRLSYIYAAFKQFPGFIRYHLGIKP